MIATILTISISYENSKERPVSALTRSTGSDFIGAPRCERAPRMQRIADRRREKDNRHLSHARVELYVSLRLVDSIEASLL